MLGSFYKKKSIYFIILFMIYIPMNNEFLPSITNLYIKISNTML